MHKRVMYVCGLTKSTMFRSHSIVYKLLPYFTVYMMILPKENDVLGVYVSFLVFVDARK